MAAYKDIARELSRAREAANMTQQDAAKHLGVTYQAVSNWERGYSKIDSVSLLELLQFYKADIYDFMESCGYVLMGRVDHSDYWLSDDAREVAHAYTNLEHIEAKNMVRGSLHLPPINNEVPTEVDTELA